jgi:hypothetical protein
MTSFLPVNTVPVSAERTVDRHNDNMTSSTPRTDPSTVPRAQEHAQAANTSTEGEENNIHSVGSAIPDKRSIVASSVSANATSTGSPGGTLSTEGSSVQSAHEDVAVGDSDGEHDGSDNETDMGDSGPPSKKKRGQRFFCTDFPPCTLSFTRSEHLARHIRYVRKSSRLESTTY